jgi:hypothetical protein
MAQLPQSSSLRRGLIVAVSALTLSAFAAVPSALAATTHTNSHASDKSQSNTSGGSSDHSKGNAGTSGVSSDPQPTSNADQNSGGANGQCPSGPYCSTRDGSASGNGNGGGKATGKPCAGCVGKADNKNPKGQMPNGSDHNAGYECDRNHGIGRTNPAHTGCRSGDTTTDCTATPTAPECTNGGTDCTATPTAPECTNGGTDCTATPTAPECTNGGTDCTATPTAPECTNGGEDCTTLPDLPECVNDNSDCTAATTGGTCTPVLGEKTTRTPTKPVTAVLGEKVARTPSGALPFTGANIALMTTIALMTLLTGTALVLSARRRRRVTN